MAALFPLLVVSGFFAPGFVQWLAIAQPSEPPAASQLSGVAGPTVPTEKPPLVVPRDFSGGLVPELLDLDQLNVTKEVPEEMTVRFGFGHSNDPSDPALETAVNFTDILVDPKTEDFFANVTGTIEHRNRTIATLAGSTTVVQLKEDITGDGKVTEEDVCADVDITFTDSGDTTNICVALQGLAQSLPFLPAPTNGTLRFGPIAF